MMRGANFVIVLLLCAIFSFGLLAQFSQNPQLALQQLLFFFVGLSIFLVISSVDIRIFKNLAILFWLIILVLVFSVTFFAPEIRGASRWIELGFFRLQPTELGKPILIFTLASILEKKSENEVKNFLKSIGVVVPFVVFSFMQPDLGNAIIFVIIWFASLFIAGHNWKILSALILAAFILSPILFLGLAPYQKLRFETFLNPSGDPLGAGYSIIQSQIAVGAGKIFGEGLTGATQSRLEFLPEAPTDFIFASLAESLGFFGFVIFMGLFLALVYQLIKAASVSDRFSQILILEVAGVLFFQFFINLAMSVGLLPVVGVTLPFVSYGGSSLVSSFILLAFVQSQIKFAPKMSAFKS